MAKELNIEEQGYIDYLLAKDFIKTFHQMNEPEKEEWEDLKRKVIIRFNKEALQEMFK